MDEQIVAIHSAEEISERVKTLAAEISETYRGREITILVVLENSFVFLSDLLRAMNIPVRTAFLRYEQQVLGGVQNLSFSTQIDMSGRDIVLMEGVLDTGIPQEYIIKQLESRGAGSISFCVLLDKPERRRSAIEPNWRAFESPDDYVFGYGLGFQERWRELPYLATFARK